MAPNREVLGRRQTAEENFGRHRLLRCRGGGSSCCSCPDIDHEGTRACATACLPTSLSSIHRRGFFGGTKRLPVSDGSVGRGAGFLAKAGLVWDLRPAALLNAGVPPGLAQALRAGAVMADRADAPPQVNAAHPKATGAVVAEPGLHGALIGWCPFNGEASVRRARCLHRCCRWGASRGLQGTQIDGCCGKQECPLL